MSRRRKAVPWRDKDKTYRTRQRPVQEAPFDEDHGVAGTKPMPMHNPRRVGSKFMKDRVKRPLLVDDPRKPESNNEKS